MGHQRRLVSVTPQWDRSEEGGVRLDQDPVAGGKLRGIADRLGLWIGKVPGKREVKPGSKRALSLFNRAGEAVHDPAEAGPRPMFADQRKQVLPGVRLAKSLLGLRGSKLARTAVNQDRFAHVGGQPHLGNEGLLLRGNLWVVVVVVVEADLANRDASRIERKAGQPAQGLAAGARGLLGMNPRARVDDWQSRSAGCVGDLQ